MQNTFFAAMVFSCTIACADDFTLAKRLDSADLDTASQIFLRVMETGDRSEWEQLHRYYLHDSERYRQILARVAHLPWKDSSGRRIRDSERVTQFNGSHYRFIHCLNNREFNAYVDAYLSGYTSSAASLLRMIESGHSFVPGENGDDGRYFGEQRLGIAIIKRKFPKLRTSYNWKTQYDADDGREIKRIASYMASQADESNSQ